MMIVSVDAATAHQEPAVTAMVQEIRREADTFVFLSGGASKMTDATKEKVLELLQALAVIAGERKLAVGDGGTKAGLMAAAGEVRRRAPRPFLLIGVAPAPDITRTGEPGKTPVEPNHTHLVAVTNEAWATEQRARGWTPDEGYWGSETDVMYDLFGRIAQGRPSATIVANGGAVTVEEVRRNMTQGRTMIVVAGSGRAADALVAVLEGRQPTDEEVKKLMPSVERLNPTSRRDLFEVFPLERGADGLAAVLRQRLTH
jgi:SLOG in TRPM, prokaryote